MKIANSHVVGAQRPLVWALLHDPEVLRRTVPGCQTLEVREDGSYAATLAVGVGPIRGRFSGTMRDRSVGCGTWSGSSCGLEHTGPKGRAAGLRSRVSVSSAEVDPIDPRCVAVA